MAAKKAEEDAKRAEKKAKDAELRAAGLLPPEPSKILILFSSLSSDSAQVANQRRLEDLIKSYKYDFYKVDGASPDQKDFRSKLFDVSKVRGKYPQCFIETGGEFEFIGLWDQVQKHVMRILLEDNHLYMYLCRQMEVLADCESLPKEVLEGNLEIKTLSRVSNRLNDLRTVTNALSCQ